MSSNGLEELIFHFMLIFARISMSFRGFPGIGDKHILSQGRLVFALMVSIIMFPSIEPSLPKYSNIGAVNFSYLAIELLIGIIISFAAAMLFQSLHTIGQIIAMQSSLSSATLFDPTQQSQVALFSNLLTIATVAILFATNTHFVFIQAIMESYRKFPPGEMLAVSDMSKFVVIVIKESFVLAFKLSSPFLVVSLAVMTGTGLLARLMPNLQVFFVITPAQILIIFATLYIVINSLLIKLVDRLANSVNFMSW